MLNAHHNVTPMNHNMSYFLVIPIMLTIITESSGQIIYPPGYINMDIRSGGLVVPINNYLSKDGSGGEEYVSNQWSQGTIVLRSGDSISNYPLKYNLVTDAVEVKTDQTVKVVPIADVQQFYWFNNGQPVDFINGSGYTMGGTPLNGYFQLLVKGTTNLFKKTYLSVQKANYRPELDVGSPEDKVVREDSYYLARGKSIMEIKNRKRVYDYFKQHRADVKKHAQQQEWNPKREEDLAAIVRYYNELTQ